MSSLTKNSFGIFEIPFRMFELPFVMSAAFMDAILSASDTTGIARQTGTSKHRAKRGKHGVSKHEPKVSVVPHQRHVA